MSSFLLDGRNQESLDFTNSLWNQIYFKCDSPLQHIEHVTINYAQIPNQLENIGEYDYIVITNLDELLHPKFNVPLGKGLFGDNDHESLCNGIETRIHQTLKDAGYEQWISSFKINAIDGKWTTIYFDNELAINWENTDVGNFLGFPNHEYGIHAETIYATYAYDPWRNFRQVYIFPNFTKDYYTFDHTYALNGLGNPWAIIPMRFSDIDFSSTSYEESTIVGLYNQDITAVDFDFILLSFFYRKDNNYFPYPFRSHELTFRLTFSD